MYDPVPGRWLQEDPAGFGAGDVNLYRYARNQPTRATDPSGLLECDDRPNHPWNKKLVDSTEKVELIINDVVRSIADDVVRQPQNDAQTFLERVYAALGEDQPGTGVQISWGAHPITTRANVTKMEDLLNHRLRFPHIVRIPFLISRYGRNALGGLSGPPGPLAAIPPVAAWRFIRNVDCGIQIGLGVIPSGYANLATANHMISPNIRVGGKVIGTDKLGHFFQQGFWYHTLTRKTGANQATRTLFGEYMEGFTNVGGGLQSQFNALGSFFFREGGFRFGIMGTASSGVASRADLNANEDGFSFYERLAEKYQNWLDAGARGRFPDVFFFSNVRIQGWSEALTRGNLLTNGLIADDNFFG